MTPAEIVRIFNAAMANVDPHVLVVATAAHDVVTVAVTELDDNHAVQGIKEQGLPGVTTACLAHDASRLDAFFRATAVWLRSHMKNRGQRGWWLYPQDLFVRILLDDPSLRSFDDFARILTDPRRRELAIACEALESFRKRPELASIAFSDDQIRALFALTPEGRMAKGLAATVASVRQLTHGDETSLRALVSMMEEWADDEYLFEQAWEDGPVTTSLLIVGTWKLLEGSLRGELRQRALRTYDRVYDHLSNEILARAGFLLPS